MKNKTSVLNNKSTTLWIYLFVLPTITIFAVFYLVPIITVFTTSFTKWDGFNPVKVVWFKNYITLFTQPEFLISIKNILLWSIIAATVHVGFGVLIAFLLYRKPFGWRFVRSVFMIPNIIAMAAWAVIYRFFFNNDFGILNNMIRVINPSFNVAWFYQSPYAFWAITFTWVFYAVIVTLIVLTDLLAIPTELHEAASIEGASSWQTVLKVDFPLIKNAIGVSMILSMTARIAMYESIALTSRGGPGDDTMSIPLILVNAITNMKYGYANAAAVAMILIGIAILFIVQNTFKMNERNN